MASSTLLLLRLLVTIATLELRPSSCQSGTVTVTNTVNVTTNETTSLRLESTSVSDMLDMPTTGVMMSITTMFPNVTSSSSVAPNMTSASTPSMLSSNSSSFSPSPSLFVSPASSPLVTTFSAVATSTVAVSTETVSTVAVEMTVVSSSTVVGVAPSSTPVSTAGSIPTDPNTGSPPSTTDSSSSPSFLVIGASVGAGILVAIVAIFLCVCVFCCIRSSRRRATYDAARDRPVYVVRRWDERTEHTFNRGGSTRSSKGSVTRSSIRSSMSSIASFLRVSGRRSRQNSMNQTTIETHTNPTVLTVTPL